MLKKIVVIAGESSGDLHAAALVNELKQIIAPQYTLSISGIGGQRMLDAGVDIIYDLARYGVTGLSGIIRHIKILRQAWKAITNHLIQNKPDILVLVDYPGFNLRLAKFAKQHLNIKVIYYISPQIWAWRANRVHHIRKYVDHMAVIFPFEKSLYTKHNVPVSFVGHPLVETINQQPPIAKPRTNFNIPAESKLIAMLPGSRLHEIDYHMPVLYNCANQLTKHIPNLHIIIPVANTIKTEHIQNHLKNASFAYTLVKEKTLDVIRCSDAAIVASGTASLECALLEKPMCIIYKGGLLSYLITSQVIRVKYFGLCNLLRNTMIVPELLQYDCTAKELTRVMLEIITNEARSKKIIANLHALKSALSIENADCSIGELINEFMN